MHINEKEKKCKMISKRTQKKCSFILYNTLNGIHSLLLKLDLNKILFVCKLLQFKSGFDKEKKRISSHRQFLKILHFLKSIEMKCNKLVIGLFLMQESQKENFPYYYSPFHSAKQKII